jgi:hypothetical protein
MSFIELLNRLKIKLLAPTTICYRQLGQYHSELKYWAWLPCFLVFRKEPVGEDGYYKTIYINGKRVKPYYIIPRNAFVEIRRKPKLITALFAIGSAVATVAAAAGASLTAAIAIGMVAGAIAGLAAIGGIVALGIGVIGALSGRGATGGGQSGTPTYSSNDNPSLSGSKNEILTGIVPICFGRTNLTFCYAQYATPLVKSGYAGNRYRVYSIAGYNNARFSDFKLGDVLLSNYRATAYSLQQANGQHEFIGWDNAVTENFNKELSFDQSQAVFQSAIAYYNKITTGTSVIIKQKYRFENVTLSAWTDKVMDVSAIVVSEGKDVVVSTQTTISKSDLVVSADDDTVYYATKEITLSIGSYEITEYRYTTTAPNANTRGSGETDLFCYLEEETITIGEEVYTTEVNQGVNSYNGDRNELLSQSPTETKYGDIHFSFPQGLYSIDSKKGSRIRVSIKAEVKWKRVGENSWRNLDDEGIEKIYTRSIDGEIEDLSKRITRNGNIFTFITPDDINNADDNFYECVGIQFKEKGQYILNIMPIVFTKDNYWVGSIYVADIVWRLDDSIPVVDESILPHVSQIACTFNATTQLDGEVDELGAINFPYITNLKYGTLDQTRNPVDVIYYLLTDTHSNPNPMSDDQIDMPSFLKARQWCEEHDCKCDGVVNEEVKYETVLNEIATNNQLYVIPNKWGKVVIRVDTNEDNRPIKTLFNADNSWDLSIVRQRGRWNRTMAIRASFIDEDTWSENEITGYWYDGKCNWTPEDGKDDTYYQTNKIDLNYIRNADNVKRRIAYELEIANEKNTTATFNVAREVLDLEVLDRVLVADYTRINDGVSGTISDILKDENGNIVGVKTSSTFVVTKGMTMTIRSVDTTGEGFNVNTYNLKENEIESSNIMFETPISADGSIIRNSGFYDVDGTEFYYSGDLYMAGTADILSMVISSIEEVKGDDFTSKITCRLY